MEYFWEAFSRWEPLGQGFFILIIFFALLTLIAQGGKFFVILFRGWPPKYLEEEDE